MGATMYSKGFQSPANMNAQSPANMNAKAIRTPHPTGTRRGRISIRVRLWWFGQIQRIK